MTLCERLRYRSRMEAILLARRELDLHSSTMFDDLSLLNREQILSPQMEESRAHKRR